MLKVVIATHSFSPGTSQALYEYMKRHKHYAMFIEHKLFGNPVYWLLGGIDTFFKVLFTTKIYDIYVGSNRLNAAVGIVLKFIGKVKKVVYFSPDWVEDRYPNKVLNNLYQWLDLFCVKYANSVWNSSAYMKVDPMMKERIKRHYPASILRKQTQVPDGTDPYPIKSWPKINRYKIGFVGHIKEGMGLEMLIESFRDVVKKVPKAKMVIIGSGPILSNIKKQARGLPIEFTGFMGDINKVYDKLSTCSFAVAPYEKGTISQYTDPGKVKVYWSVGLPIIISRVPHISKEIGLKQSGLVIDDDQDAITKAVLKLLKDEKLLKKFRKNVLGLIKKYSWDNIFDQALKTVI